MSIYSIRFTVIAFGLIHGLSSCKEAQAPQVPNSSRVNPNSAETQTQIKQTPIKPSELLILPEMASASLQRRVDLKSIGFVKGHFAPTLEIEYTLADYVEILRCPSDTPLRPSPISALDLRTAGRGISREEGENAWNLALESKCSYAALKFSNTTFTDDSAPKGEFYYLTNPCITADRSILAKEGCSYRLGISQNIRVNTSLSDKLRQKRQELSEAEAELNEILAKVRFLSARITSALEACESQVANDQAFLAFKKGIISLSSFVAFGAVGAVGLGGLMGPINGAVLGASLGSQLATQMWLYPNVFKLEDQIQNECITPYVKETNQQSREKYGSQEKTSDGSGGRNSIKSSGKYEDLYGVQSLLSAYKSIVYKQPSGQKGSLAQAIERVKQKIAESHSINSCVKDWVQLESSLKSNQLSIENVTPENAADYASQMQDLFSSGSLGLAEEGKQQETCIQ